MNPKIDLPTKGRQIDLINNWLCTSGFCCKLRPYQPESATPPTSKLSRMKFSGRHFPKDIILQAVRWYITYPLSLRMIKEIFAERGITVNHTTINRWVIVYAPQLEALHRKQKPAVKRSWRMDETYIKIKGRDCYLYRAVDKEGNTVDFLLTKKRDKKLPRPFSGRLSANMDNQKR